MPVYAVNVITGWEEPLTHFINKNIKNARIREAYNILSIFNSPVFPGYIFVDMEFGADTYRALLNVPGVLCFLSPDFGIFPVSKEEKIRLEKARKNIKSPIGATVEIVRGKYEGTIGKISEINYPNLQIIPENFFHLEKKSLISVTINQVVLRDNITPFKAGVPVTIIQGEYAGLKGTIEKVNYPHVIVSSDIFGKEILIKSHVSDVEVITC